LAEFKEFERRFKFKPRFKYGGLPLKLYQMFQDLSRRLILSRVLADLNRGSNSLNSISCLICNIAILVTLDPWLFQGSNLNIRDSVIIFLNLESYFLKNYVLRLTSLLAESIVLAG